MSQLAEHLSVEDRQRYTAAAEGCEFFGVRARDMSREDLLILLGFAVTDFPRVTLYDNTRRQRVTALSG